MAAAVLRILTDISLHIAGVDYEYVSGATPTLDDAVLNLVARGLAEVV